MKDKRTYTHLKEHGEDMTHENESKVDPKEDRGPLDITLLTEQYKADLYAYKEREGLYLKTENQLKKRSDLSRKNFLRTIVTPLTSVFFFKSNQTL